jgi:hypothetical protein
MLYARHESGGLGSDSTVIAHDLKTARGLKKRILRGVYRSGMWTIYRCNREDWYTDKGHRWEGQVRKASNS